MLKYAEKGYFCDSILYHANKKDSLLRAALLVKDEQLKISDKVITGQAKKITRLNWIVAGLGTMSAGLLLALLVVLF